MTLTTSDILLLIIAVSVAAMAVALLRLFGPVARAARELEQLSRCANALRPDIERVLREAEGGLSEARQVAQRAEAIAADLQALSGVTKGLAVPLLARVGALAAGARAGLEALQRWGRTGQHGPNGRGGVR